MKRKGYDLATPLTKRRLLVLHNVKASGGITDNKWKCPFEKIRKYPDCFQDCPDIEQCKMKDVWKQVRPLPKWRNSASFPIEIKHIQVIPFAKAMDEVLCKNDHKGGWDKDNCSVEYLQARLVEEVGEYFKLVAMQSENNRSLGGKELLDIANFCMMLWDRSWE